MDLVTDEYAAVQISVASCNLSQSEDGYSAESNKKVFCRAKLWGKFTPALRL